MDQDNINGAGARTFIWQDRTESNRVTLTGFSNPRYNMTTTLQNIEVHEWQIPGRTQIQEKQPQTLEIHIKEAVYKRQIRIEK